MNDETARGMGLIGCFLGVCTFILIIIIAFDLSCETQPDIDQLQKMLCERTETTPAGYQDCLEEVQ